MKKTNGQRDKIATLRVGVIGLECSGQDMPGCIWMYFVHQVQSVIFLQAGDHFGEGALLRGWKR